MARRSGPTLYEAMSKSGSTGTSSSLPGRRPHPTESDRPSTPVMFTPGSVVRLPVGYVWVIVVVAMAGVIGAYLLGHGRGVEAGRTEMEQTLAARDRVSQETSRIREPDPSPGEGSGAVAAVESPSSPRKRVVEPPSSRGPSVPPPPPGGPVQVDGVEPADLLLERRKSGNAYYILVATNHEVALATAEIVRSEVRDLGLDAQVLAGDNLSYVLLLPGFQKSSLSDEERRNWEERLDILRSRVVGKVNFRKKKPFSDAYPSVYQ